MAKSTEPGWPSRCDSLHRFHLFWAATLRGGSNADSGAVWQSRLALGDPRDCWDAHRAVSRVIKHSARFSSARNLDRRWFRCLAMGNSVRICEKRDTSRLAVLCCDRGKSASACGVQVFSGHVAKKPVWFSRHFLHYLSRP